jgi:predicted DNA-binding transcriptional regulator AlpA
MDENAVVDWKGIKSRFGVPYSRAHIWRMMKARTFPQCFKLGKHRNSHPVWWVRDIIAWLTSYAKH